MLEEQANRGSYIFYAIQIDEPTGQITNFF
jgi:zinc finger SWIM domain-containing protein 3